MEKMQEFFNGLEVASMTETSMRCNLSPGEARLLFVLIRASQKVATTSEGSVRNEAEITLETTLEAMGLL